MGIKFVDLFAGIGGIRLGFENAMRQLGINTECVLSSEIDKKACETYELNFSEVPAGDIYEISEITDDFDFLLAGFPCQSFSYAGKKRGFGDTRGTLFFEIERLLKKHKPRGFLLENVRGLVSHDKGRTLTTIIEKLETLGYKVDYMLLNSSNFGVPQNRVRIYIIGLLGKEPLHEIQSDTGSSDSHNYKTKQLSMFDSELKYPKVQDILESDSNITDEYTCTDEFTNMLSKVVGNNYNKLHGVRLIDYRGGNSIHSWELGLKGDCTQKEIQFMNALIANRRKKIFGTHQDGKMLTLKQIKTFFDNPELEEIISSLIKKGYLKEVDGKYNPVAGNMSFEVFKFLDPDSISITLTSSDCHRLGIVQNNMPRRITPRECARLQGFPDNFICHPNDISAYKQFGNTVSVPVVEKVILDLFENNSKYFSSNIEEEQVVQY
ncbi:cytosine-specific methyltransferase [Halobacillus andaensis]|uniref:Cytosine-specific methyltransferase n=1 Tax=Halobacillus andaensis TaxID=1176239 RepID=A0A917B3U9_HALAA|nr:DNA cytosine methyltransferase [Halobacillus andaensis]MBP2004919.1 DNA (cytosine-5)-methyltransferase 1 [Halobacillus andaensis]GGF17885.1 cytosine-specific methyltransferase [Halobacillus andaensis]